MRRNHLLATAALLAGAALGLAAATAAPGDDALDAKVRSFLDRMSGRWHDMNVPETDGRLLHDIVLKNGYRRALEIGTSTGHSGVWIAWALARTGGRLVTIEIDPDRRAAAVGNFRQAGLDGLIESRLGDAHEVVRELSGPFDFVFIDAEKEGYRDYAEAVIPKLAPGGCIAAHNVHASRGWRRGGAGDYYDAMAARPDFRTEVLSESRSGLAVSYKTGPARDGSGPVR